MSGKNQILMVEETEADRAALREILDSDYEIIEAESVKQALAILNAAAEPDEFSAVLLHFVHSKHGAYSFLQEYQKTETYRRIPVIIAAEEEDAAAERECLMLGAWDFVRKPYDPRVLCLRLGNIIERSQQQMSRELKYRANFDPLTGIYNKMRFFEETRLLLERYPNGHFAFLRIDIAKFQLVNTFFGVKEGDRLLRYIAGVLREFSGRSLRVCYGRIEADIFCMCMPYHKEAELEEFIRYLRSRIWSCHPDYDLVPTVGIYVIEDPALSIDRMYDRANLAVKQCKGNYIRNYAFYTPDMSEALLKEQRIAGRMQNALEAEEFVLYLQPKYDLQNNTIEGAEVLVRWISPSEGAIPPGEFIPIFERNGFITKLDFYVWEKTCQLLAKWLREGRNPEPVSVNISRVSLYNPRLVETITGLVDKYQIPPRLLQLELTESACTNNLQAIHEMMEKLQRVGFSILMDDFGSGYSSLNVLKDITVDILKIDMKFLSDTSKQGRSENILASVVRMAKWLDMPVIAEGVERREQADFLRSIGCEYVQGFYFAKPMSVEDYETLAFAHKGNCSAPELPAETNADSLWTSTSQMEILFSDMLQAVAVYEYEDETERLDILRVNNAYYELFGYQDIDDAQKSILNSVDIDGQNTLKAAFREVVKTREMTDCEFVRQGESGTWMWIQLKLKYINQVGKKHVIFGTLTNITEQKEIDRELQRYRQAFAVRAHEDKTLLIVDDVEVNRVSLRCIFEEKYRVLEAENGKSALECLKEHPGEVDVILLDLVMPQMDGVEFLHRKKMDSQLAGIPVVIITSDDTTRRQAQAMELGADDYIVKPFIPEIAKRRVHNVIEAQRRLTGALKRYSANDVQSGAALFSAQGVPDMGIKALLLVEINNLSEIADAYTYKVAEQISYIVAERLKRHFAAGNIVARCSRREFVITFMEQLKEEELTLLCRLFLHDVGEIGADGIQLDCSIGAVIAKGDGESFAQMAELADQALYDALQKGKNQFAVRTD